MKICLIYSYFKTCIHFTAGVSSEIFVEWLGLISNFPIPCCHFVSYFNSCSCSRDHSEANIPGLCISECSHPARCSQQLHHISDQAACLIPKWKVWLHWFSLVCHLNLQSHSEELKLLLLLLDNLSDSHCLVCTCTCIFIINIHTHTHADTTFLGRLSSSTMICTFMRHKQTWQRKHLMSGCW